MSSKPDPHKAEQARQDGNTSFKKGRWVEAIGHYTTAVVHSPGDHLPYTNRAAAYLKLDKCEDARRDCTRALEISPGHVKALYRRAVALKGLGRYEESLRGVVTGRRGLRGLTVDLEEVLKVEGKNEIAQSELEEVESLLARQRRQEEERTSRRKTLPPSPPRAAATIEEIQDDPVGGSVPNVEDSRRSSEARGVATFSDLRKHRAERKTYTSNIKHDPDLQNPSSDAPSIAQRPPAKPSEVAGPAFKSRPAGSQSYRPVSPPSDPLSTSSAAGFALLTKLSRLDIPTGWDYLTHYPPSVVPIILAPLLEPEALGRLLVVLRHGVDQEPGRVKELLEGLKVTSRWRINTAMLEPAEEKAGKEAWSIAGVSRSWS